MKNKGIIIAIAIALLVAAWYFLIYKKPASTTATPPLLGNLDSEGNPVASPVTTPLQTSQSAVLNSPPSQPVTATAASQTLTTVDGRPTTSTASPTPVTVGASQYDAIILPWMNGLGAGNKKQALAMYPSMTDAEKSSLADLIVNVWGGKRAQNSNDTAFWNTWRVKYHILDGTYSPFSGEDAQTAYAGSNNFDDQDAYNPGNIKPIGDPQRAYNGFTQKGAASTAYNGFVRNKR